MLQITKIYQQVRVHAQRIAVDNNFQQITSRRRVYQATGRQLHGHRALVYTAGRYKLYLY